MILAYLPQLLSGLSITLILLFSAIGAGLVLALSLVVCDYSDHFLVKKLIASLIFFIRGTPLLVQIFLIYYGLGQLTWVRSSFLWFFLREPMVCAIIALSINTACYTAVIIKGAIASVPRNEIDACYAIGMSKWLTLRRIVLPRAFRIMLPAYSNEVLMILKSTSLASTITLLEIMGVTQQLIAETYDTVKFYLIAAVIYLLLNMVITSIFMMLRKNLVLPNNA
ncbi:MAG: arginine transporter permease subunit ArtM [Gammaproteobacteria bacterium RIFCSPHIGHO2_12_FULL_38_11]|nr:MAG: arginine transporter permease subunit ArtM [Gammaproteobacteria bacterium RIFCSPHIGHO2_12_FULL_38_11]